VRIPLFIDVPDHFPTPKFYSLTSHVDFDTHKLTGSPKIFAKKGGGWSGDIWSRKIVVASKFSGTHEKLSYKILFSAYENICTKYMYKIYAQIFEKFGPSRLVRTGGTLLAIS
jgi:hypothetical protein